MAIIKASKKFIGGDISNRASTKYIKDGVRQVVFNKSENKDGAYLYFLPPYKTDAEGNGVWYKAFRIRDNFGDKFKEKYALREPNNDAVEHFEKSFKVLFPDLAKVVDETDEKGQTRKRYPLYGRKTTRVVFNVAYVNHLDKGNHVLDLPSYMGASQLLDWLEAKDARGKDRPMVNDPERMIPVFVKLKDGGSGNPWQIIPDPNDVSEIPDELADSDFIYNLDDVFDYKSNEELIEKLRGMYAPDVFNACMEGFSGFDRVLVPGFGPAAEAPVARPKAKPTPTAAPAVNNLVRSAKVEEVVEEDQIPMEYVDEDDAPATVAPPKVSKAAAADFLKRGKSGV